RAARLAEVRAAAQPVPRRPRSAEPATADAGRDGYISAPLNPGLAGAAPRANGGEGGPPWQRGGRDWDAAQPPARAPGRAPGTGTLPWGGTVPSGGPVPGTGTPPRPRPVPPTGTPSRPRPVRRTGTPSRPRPVPSRRRAPGHESLPSRRGRR